jgi:hypothetical protein
MTRIIRTRALLLVLLAGLAGVASAQNKNDHGRAVAGKYGGTTFIELMQMELPLQLELQRVHNDSVIVKITNFALPNGQLFNFTSRGVSVKPDKETKGGYRLHVAFTYNYNNMPVRVEATGTVKGTSLDAEVKAVVMESMETRVTYKARKVS